MFAGRKVKVNPGTASSKKVLIVKCEMSDERFVKRWELECHMKSNHEECEKFECKECKKEFVTKWRLKKHEVIHTGKVKKQCYYFNNNVICPFDDLGCKFIHSIDPYHSVIDKSIETENESGLEEANN